LRRPRGKTGTGRRANASNFAARGGEAAGGGFSRINRHCAPALTRLDKEFNLRGAQPRAPPAPEPQSIFKSAQYENVDNFTHFPSKKLYLPSFCANLNAFA
jgi:hypothetical protein